MNNKEGLRRSEQVDVFELPEVVDSPFPYVVLGDLKEVTSRLKVDLSPEEIMRYQLRLFQILSEAAPEGSTYIPTVTGPIIRKIEEGIVDEVLRCDCSVGVVQLDRYIGLDIDDGRCFRLNVSRGVNGGLMSRPGTVESPEDQISNLLKWVSEGQYSKLLFVDDVLAFGDTLVPLINGVKEVLPEAEIEVLVGIASSGGIWSGKEKVKDLTGVEVRAVTTVMASEANDWTSGMALPTARDFTFLGGKVLSGGDTQYSFPYFLPFSVPVISFMPVEVRFEISKKLIDLSIDIVRAIDTSGRRRITVGDLVEAGFGVPMSKMKCLEKDLEVPDESTLLADYIEYYKYLLENKRSEIEIEAGVVS